MDNIIFREGYVIRDQNATHFLTFTVCGWIDLFTRKAYKDILIDSFKYCQQKKGLVLNAFVIMPNHVHLIASTKEGFKLSDIIRDFKKFTHRNMMKIIQSDVESRRLWMLHQFAYYATRHGRNENYQIWVHDSHPEALYTSEMTMTKLWYTHDNPVRAGWVVEQQHYLYSSALIMLAWAACWKLNYYNTDRRSFIKYGYEVWRLRRAEPLLLYEVSDFV